MQQLSNTYDSNQPPMGAFSPSSGGAERQMLTFTLGMPTSTAEAEGSLGCATNYGIDLVDVQEIRGYSPATPIPNTPAYIKGAINLRGAVIPVIDLRMRFGVA